MLEKNKDIVALGVLSFHRQLGSALNCCPYNDIGNYLVAFTLGGSFLVVRLKTFPCGMKTLESLSYITISWSGRGTGWNFFFYFLLLIGSSLNLVLG